MYIFSLVEIFDVDYELAHKIKYFLKATRRGLISYHRKGICTYVCLDLPATVISRAEFMRLIVANVLRKSLRLNPHSVRSSVGTDD